MTNSKGFINKRGKDNKNIELVILKKPSTNVGCFDEIDLWLKLGWIKLYAKEK